MGVLQSDHGGIVPTGKPTDNAFVEASNGSLRKELLNASWFDTLDQARVQRGRGVETTTRTARIDRWPTKRRKSSLSRHQKVK